MSETDPVMGDDYHEELRRLAAESADLPVGGNPKGSKYNTKKSAESDLDELLDAPLPEPGRGEIQAAAYDYSVITPSGATLPVLTEHEVAYYEDRARRYTEDHVFTSITDLQDLDRVLSTELVLYRYDVWLTLGQDYWGQAVSERDLLKYIKDLSMPLQNLKKSMGLDKATRDKDQGADFASWLESVRKRAREFGIMREEQLTTGITLFHEIKAKVQSYRNADAIEREELGLQPERILDWMWEVVFPKFDAVDQYFINRKPDPNDPDDEGGQRFWKSV